MTVDTTGCSLGSTSRRAGGATRRGCGPRRGAHAPRARGDEVELLRWPADATRLDELASCGVPCLVLVGAGPHPPICSPLQDWVRLPVDPTELEARRATLAARAAARARLVCRVDPDGTVRSGDRWAALSTKERALFELLVARVGHVVATEALMRAASTRRDATLRVQVTRLRSRVAPLGLEIVAVRSRGYVLRRAAWPSSEFPVEAVQGGT